MRQSGIRAGSVLAGVTVYFFGSLAFQIVTVLLLAAVNALRGAPASEKQLMSFLLKDNGGLFFLLASDMVFMFFGGYASARQAGRLELMHGALAGLGGLLLNLLLGLASGPDQVSLPMWYQVLSLGLLIPAAVYGGFLARKSSPGEKDLELSE